MILKNRKYNRLKNYDYSQNGYYFVTICVKDKIEYFGKIENNKMILNEIGKIANQCWLEIPKHFPDVKLDEHIIMPNHLHGIVVIENNPVGTIIIVPIIQGTKIFVPYNYDKNGMAQSHIHYHQLFVDLKSV